MKYKDRGRVRGGGLINFPPLKRGGLLERGGGGVNRGFTVITLEPCRKHIELPEILILAHLG